ncbi:[FeFe] hydrogenase H-cluster radical SAM maturase HydG [Clostridium cellulovorans]|uniref:Biotin and thiamin synthesis associated n=1 Tax=Clostridium cellulovorans (strain ATCC 35296 / DSM 3052 / OCM 3 / 743B) TaxID=573061 RepID=D9SVQ0_CLOC7|nr:[FeFe] hydrogenase H-cluster radical SAM maturase HydG [Clostridium cellulovorans]ADL53111.1 biotin and thiamin synthesis associated [Clostridium cellulovorans 743B]
MTFQKASFIDDEKIKEYLKLGEEKAKDKEYLKSLIERSKDAKGLSIEEISALIFTEDDDILEKLYETSHQVKESIYGNRIVMFAPLYVSNHCVNGCTYCGFSCKNQEKRRKLTQEEVAREVEIIESMGHKRIVIESGEHPKETPIEYILDCMKTIYSVNKDNGSIRRVNVNIAATTVEEYRMLKEAGIGTYTLFQETYHRETYSKMHPTGPKHDYDYHTTAMDRAMEGGIDDVGIGVLFGLYDYKYELMGLFMHANHLEEAFGVGPHTISVPRLKPAIGMDLEKYPYLVNDKDFKKLVAIIRVAVPYTGMLISTREEPSFRKEVIHVGISQVSAGSITEIGGYYDSLYGDSNLEGAQFEGGDNRTAPEILKELCRDGYIPSFCTGCYRQGRTGERFMALAKTGNIQNVCLPNALMTFKEYLVDYADDELKEIGLKAIEDNLKNITNEKILILTKENLAKIESGTRDLYL